MARSLTVPSGVPSEWRPAVGAGGAVGDLPQQRVKVGSGSRQRRGRRRAGFDISQHSTEAQMWMRSCSEDRMVAVVTEWRPAVGAGGAVGDLPQQSLRPRGDRSSHCNSIAEVKPRRSVDRIVAERTWRTETLGRTRGRWIAEGTRFSTSLFIAATSVTSFQFFWQKNSLRYGNLLVY